MLSYISTPLNLLLHICLTAKVTYRLEVDLRLKLKLAYIKQCIAED